MSTASMNTPPPNKAALKQAFVARRNALWLRIALLTLILLAFARVMVALDAKDLWWDESLSLQRAESDWGDLLLGRLPLRDGLSELVTYDQHPFFFFALQRMLLRIAGNSEVVLRLPSVMAATVLVPLLWAWGKRLARLGIAPPGTAAWAALLAAAHPFFLWYGQEARPYALWAMLALLSTYCLWRATQEESRWGYGAAVCLPMFYTTHYFSLFLLPVHALLLSQWLWPRSRRWAMALPVAVGGVGVVVAALLYWLVIVRQEGGGNFSPVAWNIILPDLLNAFSMGPSANIEIYWWLDVTYGVLALVGAAVALRHVRVIVQGGWLIPSLVVVPVAVLLTTGLFVPAYMNARHMSLIGGGAILLAAGGLAFIGARTRVVGGAVLAALLVGGMVGSSLAYFVEEEYAKDDFSGLGAYLDRRVAPGDLLLYQSPFAWRAFSYYGPLERVQAAQRAGVPIAAYGVPLIGADWEERDARLDAWTAAYRRIWFIRSNTHPYMDLEGRTQAWLDANLFIVERYSYFSHSSLARTLYLREVPVFDSIPPALQQPDAALDASFGAAIRVLALRIDPVGIPPTDDLALPVTLAWTAQQDGLARYKYILQLVEEAPGETAPRVLAQTEREPYDGAIATVFWDPGKVIVEYSELPPRQWTHAEAAGARVYLTLQLYNAITLEKLPVELLDGGARGAEVAADGFTLRLPDWPPAQAGR